MQDINRNIVLSSDIDEMVAKEVISQIVEINQIDEERIVHINGYEPKPIEMIINSAGGHVSDGFAIIGAMEMSETPIITYGIGNIASMALAIFLAGDIRISSRHTRFMYHSIAYGMAGQIADHEEQAKECNILQEMYNSFVFERTKFTAEKLAEIRNSKKNYYFSASQAKRLGVVDEFIKKPEPRLKMVSEEELKEIEGENTKAVG